MAASSVDQLKEQIETLPATLRAALERQARARIAVAQLEAQIDKLEAKIAYESSERNGEDNDLEGELALLKLETTLERIKLRLAEAEDEAELEFRSSALKTTEGHVKAAVGTDQTVSRLRHELLDAKEAARARKITLQHERQIARIAEHGARFALRTADAPENQELPALQDELASAQEEMLLADVEVDVAGATIDTYRMMVQVESLEK
jgi:chromosome segregation ATPase